MSGTHTRKPAEASRRAVRRVDSVRWKMSVYISTAGRGAPSPAGPISVAWISPSGAGTRASSSCSFTPPDPTAPAAGTDRVRHPPVRRSAFGGVLGVLPGLGVLGGLAALRRLLGVSPDVVDRAARQSPYRGAGRGRAGPPASRPIEIGWASPRLPGRDGAAGHPGAGRQ